MACAIALGSEARCGSLTALPALALAVLRRPCELLAAQRSGEAAGVEAASACMRTNTLGTVLIQAWTQAALTSMCGCLPLHPVNRLDQYGAEVGGWVRQDDDAQAVALPPYYVGAVAHIWPCRVQQGAGESVGVDAVLGDPGLGVAANGDIAKPAHVAEEVFHYAPAERNRAPWFRRSSKAGTWAATGMA